MDTVAFKYIAAALAMLPLLGIGLGLGNFLSTYVSSIARNPDIKEELSGKVLLYAALIEFLALLCFLVAIFIFFVIK